MEKEIEKMETETEEIVEEEIIEESVEEKLTNEVTELKDKLLRNQAELENFKRRTYEERIKERKYAQQSLLTKLIDLSDNFERALKTEEESDAKLREGLELMQKQLNTILEESQVTRIEAVGKEFDPNFHQAVMTTNNDELEDDIVSDELQAGYMYKDRILRPSMVLVNKKGEK